MTEYAYDALGNVINETRTLALPETGGTWCFHSEYTYDSWGRMLAMTYPDGEVVRYHYQWGGELRGMTGSKGTDTRKYIDSIQYNIYGQKAKTFYGNGTSAEYGYDALHRLTSLKSHDAAGHMMQNISYTLNNASDITGVSNTAAAIGPLGGPYSSSYNYDALHRLTYASNSGSAGGYNFSMHLTSSGRIDHKNSSSSSSPADMIYGYCDGIQPHKRYL